ncbi:MAG TPA: glycosyltransferase family 4 protein, partial [Rhodothermales bacterium]
RLWSGCYACDWDRFAAVRERAKENRPKAFLYVGRYVPVKGMPVLLEAYRTYRTMVRSPWPLICAGAGPLKSLLEGQEGVTDHGFVQPDALPELMARASAFVLASNREPWGVVVQEAAATGMPLICSDACGASVHLLQDGYNGFVFETGNSSHLAECMARVSEASDDAFARMSEGSFELSKQFTPERWAETLVKGIASLIGNAA